MVHYFARGRTEPTHLSTLSSSVNIRHSPMSASLGTTILTSLGEKINIRILNSEDKATLISTLALFATDEPLSKFLQIPTAQHEKLFAKLVDDNVHKQISFVAVSELTGKIVGALINEVVPEDASNDGEDYEESDDDDFEHDGFAVIQALLNRLEKRTLITQGGKWLDIVFGVVDPAYKNQKIFSAMCALTLAAAREKQFDGVTAACVSAEAKKTFISLGMHCVRELQFSDYHCPVTNQCLLQQMAETTPCKSICLMVKQLGL